MADEYLMALNGAFALHAVALLFPTTHSAGLWWSDVVCIHFGASLVSLAALSDCATRQLPVMSSKRLAIKQSIGSSAEAHQLHTPVHPPLSCSFNPYPAPRAWTCHHQGQQITCQWRPSKSFMLHIVPYTSGCVCQYFCPLGIKHGVCVNPVEKIKILTREQHDAACRSN